MNNYAMDTAVRFGDIPYVDFTRDLVTGVFDSLVDAHVLQMEEYSNFISSLTLDLSAYINNTKDGVSFDQISDFVQSFELPTVDNKIIETALSHLDKPKTSVPKISANDSVNPATEQTWWGGLINALAPAVTDLVDKLDDPSEALKYKALTDYNRAVLEGVELAKRTVPTYRQIYDSVGALIASNKYGLLQTMAKQGIMRLVVTEGEIETKITFSTWNNTSSGNDQSLKTRQKNKSKAKDVRGGGFLGFFKNKRKRKNSSRTVTINTAKSYQRDSSGTKVDIFGRVLLKFKSDYAPLNG